MPAFCEKGKEDCELCKDDQAANERILGMPGLLNAIRVLSFQKTMVIRPEAFHRPVERKRV
jgi:hypothetical protein